MMLTNASQLYQDLEAAGSFLTQRGKILQLLLDRKIHPLSEVRCLASQYNARIHELRRVGYDIVSLRKGDETFFKLKGGEV